MVYFVEDTIWAFPVSIPSKVFGNFQVTYFVCPLSVDLGRIQLLTEMITKKLHWGRCLDLINLPS